MPFGPKVDRLFLLLDFTLGDLQVGPDVLKLFGSFRLLLL